MKHIRGVAVGAVLWAALSVAAAAPTAVTQARNQLEGGDAAAAVRSLDAYLANAPLDADARFLRGMALVKMNRRTEAIDNFRALTHDFPKLPEPYNNLAVLYAEQGDLELARGTLESLLVQQPEYAPAHENLGDVYAALAAKSYGHALSLSPNSAGVRAKLALVTQIGSSPNPLAAAANAH